MHVAIRSFLACTLAMCLAITARAQGPKPGPEHEAFKQTEGVWDATVKLGGFESKGIMTYRMGLGGLWLLSDFKGDFAGQPFEGRRLETYDAAKKKYVSIWIDSMSTAPLVMEGTYDKDKKTWTMTGEGPRPGGTAKFKSVTKIVDADTIEFALSEARPDGKDVGLLAISYKRKK